MSGVVADTHTAIWYLLGTKNLSTNAAEALDRATDAGYSIYVASISLIEVIYLVERGRIPEIALELLNKALSESNTGFVIVPLDLGVAQMLRKIPRDMIPDMPDRIIAATALHLNVPLVTRDTKILASGIDTIW
ncbi:type II toxin-antitoxin system VapC family toxin [Fischerella sp. PCC 9605]|uniref:type II toxin-antitoxin system VapC family toxin n=1 Tax=Fischerella sp. PCC 9605 TaxID=1173024 RepID=UPI000478DC46|nr:type II toxin-antitoxin system VapC family toxin [Fischerella sp. PCC 9605]